MPFSPVDTLPVAPQRSDPPDDFADTADAFVTALKTFSEQINVFIGELELAAALINAAPAYTDPGLLALAGNTPAADKLPYYTGAGSSALATITAVARTLLAQATQADLRQTGLGMTANGSSLVTAADYAAMRTLLGVPTTSDVAAGYQPLDSDLTAIAALATTTFGRGLLTQADAAAARSTLGVQGALTSGSDANGEWIGLAIGATTYYFQWGRITASANSTTAITFPQAYTTAASISVSGSGVDGAGGIGAQDNGPGISAYSTTGASVFSADDTACTFHWQAMGY